MIAKKVCLQKRICQRLVLSKDLTIKPPKLKQKAPKKTSNGPGILFINQRIRDLKYIKKYNFFLLALEKPSQLAILKNINLME